MRVEILIYVYMFICASLMVFNTFYVVVMRRINKSIEANTDIYALEISAQLDRIKIGLQVADEHKHFLYKKLKHISQLTAFDKGLDNLYSQRRDDAKEYLSEIYTVFIKLSSEYKKKDNISAAYFPYIISKYQLLKLKSDNLIVESALELLHSDNVYCRENVLKVIYSMGDVGYVLKALKIIDSGNNFHHSKLICDGMMTFSGDKNELSQCLWNEFEKFSVKMQINILNFMRFAGIRNDDKMYALLDSEKAHKENKLACIRYFEKFYYLQAEGVLHKLAKNEIGYDWEYQAIASSALKTYPGHTTEEILKANLSNPNWYVRYNSAESCEKLGLTYSDLIDIFNGKDRYAREMAQYRFDRKAVQKEVSIN